MLPREEGEARLEEVRPFLDRGKVLSLRLSFMYVLSKNF